MSNSVQQSLRWSITNPRGNIYKHALKANLPLDNTRCDEILEIIRDLFGKYDFGGCGNAYHFDVASRVIAFREEADANLFLMACSG